MIRAPRPKTPGGLETASSSFYWVGSRNVDNSHKECIPECVCLFTLVFLDAQWSKSVLRWNLEITTHKPNLYYRLWEILKSRKWCNAGTLVYWDGSNKAPWIGRLKQQKSTVPSPGARIEKARLLPSEGPWGRLCSQLLSELLVVYWWALAFLGL